MRKFDDLINSKCATDLVNKMACTNVNGERGNYSFATKYASFHCPEKYPIYDSFVDDALWNFKGDKKNKDKFFEIYRYELKDYEKFTGVMQRFRNVYELEKFTWKELDRYLWLVGRCIKN